MKRKESVKEAKSAGERMGRQDGKGSRGNEKMTKSYYSRLTGILSTSIWPWVNWEVPESYIYIYIYIYELARYERL